MIRTEDPYGHGNSISYTDSFSDTINRNTFAYATTITGADRNSSYVQFNFDFGATTRTQSPAPANQSQGAVQTITYDSIGRTERTTMVNNGAYTRYVYGPNYVQSFSTVNNIADEAYNIQVFDGVGRIIASAGNHHRREVDVVSGECVCKRELRTVSVSHARESSPKRMSIGGNGTRTVIHCSDFARAVVGQCDGSAGRVSDSRRVAAPVKSQCDCVAVAVSKRQ